MNLDNKNKKKGLFNRTERNVLAAWCALVASACVVIACILWPTAKAEASEVVVAEPVKVIQPRPKKVPESTQFVVVDLDIKAGEVAYISSEEVEDDYVHDAILKLHSDSNCTVILGKPQGIGQKTVRYTAGKSGCHVIAVGYRQAI